MIKSAELRSDQLALLREMLEQQQRFRVDQLSEPMPNPGTMTAPELEVREAVLSNAQLALADVEAALDRMRTGTYGHCVHCGVQLSIERLEVVPQAALCMACQQRADVTA